MNDPVMFVLGLLAIGVVVLMLVEHDPRMHDAPTRDEMTTVIPDPFAPHEPKHVDDMRAIDTPYVAMRYFGPDNYGERTLAIAREKARAFQMLYGVAAHN
jgi:hypothetical protein